MIGPKIRELREQNHILLRQLAAQLEIDTTLLSKMERGERFFKREDIVMLAKLFQQPEHELLTLWLADKVLKTLQNQKYQKQALEIALENI